MAAWTSDELQKVGTAEELQVMSLREDGTLSKPVTIWVTRVGNDVYVRSVRGLAGGWYQGTQVQHEGRIRAGGVEKEVSFVNETDPARIQQVDAAYREKYHRYPPNIANSVLTPEARAATLKLAPR